MKKMIRTLSLIAAVVTLSASADDSPLSLNPIFSDNAVLQAGKPTVFRGTASPQQEVSVTFGALSGKTTANADGSWSVALEIGAANAIGEDITIRSDKASIVRKDVVVGAVYLFARQSHVDTTLKTIPEGTALPENLRFARIEKTSSKTPRRLLDPKSVSGWKLADTDNAPAMFAASFHFGSQLVAATNIPVGIIDLHLGNDLHRQWISNGEGLLGTIIPLEGIGVSGLILQAGNQYPYYPFFGPDQEADATSMSRTSMRGVIKPTHRNPVWRFAYKFKRGMFGEDKAFPQLPGAWRTALGNADLPIGLVLTPGKPQYLLGEANRYRRGVQVQTAAATDHCEPLIPGRGRRMFSNQVGDESLLVHHALNWALNTNHARNVTPSGPAITGFRIVEGKAIVHFMNGTAAGLSTVDGKAPATFEVAGADGIFVPATAEIKDCSVIVSSAKVSDIKFLRYDCVREPYHSLQNGAGLRAAPWTNEKMGALPYLSGPEEVLPEVYTKAARDWPKDNSALAILDGRMRDIAYLLGPTGIGGNAVGVNLYVSWVQKGSPAWGLMKPGDYIYSANDHVFALEPLLPNGSQRTPLMAFGNAISESETAELKGNLTLGVGRGDINTDVVIKLDVLGAFSTTTPYDCPKTERLIEKAIAGITNNDNPLDNRFGGVLSTDALFLLGTKDPSYLPYVMRRVYKECRIVEEELANETKPPHYIYFLSYRGILFAEYYLATGDETVLPTLKLVCDALSSVQQPNGGWGKNWIFSTYPSARGYMMQSSLSTFIALILAREAGVAVNEQTMAKAEVYHRERRGEFAQYGYGSSAFKGPWPEDAARDASGMGDGSNGKVALGAIAYRLLGDTATADTCARHAAVSYNTLNNGYEGNCWNVAWTPLGAFQAGREPFITFMKNGMWYRELFRRFDNTMECQPNPWVGDRRYGVNGFYNLALIAPRQGLRILNSPKSPFASPQPASLKPVFALRRQKKYAESMALLRTLQANGSIPAGEQALATAYVERTTYFVDGLTANMAWLQQYLADGKMGEAKGIWALDACHLKTLLGVTTPEIKAIETALADSPVAAVELNRRPARDQLTPSAKDGDKTWTSLVGSVQDRNARDWKAITLEMIEDAPRGWTLSGFDDSTWPKQKMPTVWCPDHVALFRTTFDVENRGAVRALRMLADIYCIYDLDVYLNGVQIIESCNLHFKGVGGKRPHRRLKPEALALLKEKDNTLCLAVQHYHRWAYHPYKTVPFTFALEADSSRHEE